MLKYIQEMLQTLLRETQKTKIKQNKTRTNSFLSSKRKTSIHPEILAPVGNEKHELENTHHVLKIKKTYNMLMKKLVNPNLDLMPRGNKILEQIKNMDSKQRQEMFSSLLPNTFFGKTKKKKLPGPPFDEKLQHQEKIQQSNTNNFAIGWSGQATTKSLKPIVEVASKYPFDIDSAFLDYTDIKKLNNKKSGKEHTKKLKKVSHKRNKKTKTAHASTINSKTKKSVQLLKEIPKSRISKLYRLNAERRERALQQSVLEPLQGVYTSDSPTNKSVVDVTDSKNQPTTTDIDVNNNSDAKYQQKTDTVSSSVEKSKFEEKGLKYTGIADHWDESSQNDHSHHEKQQNSIYEKSQDYEKHDKQFVIKKQFCANENIYPETNGEKQNTDEFVLTKLNGKCNDIKHHQNNVDNSPSSETAHEVGSTTDKIGSIFPKIIKYHDINLPKVKDLERGNKFENNPNFLINDEKTEKYYNNNNKNTNDSAVKTDSDEINQIMLSNKPTKYEGTGLSGENVSLVTKESMNSDSTCVKSQTNRRVDPILEKIGLTNTPKKDFEREDNLKKPTLSYKNPNNLNQLQYLKNARSSVKNEVVYSKLLKMEKMDFNKDISFLKNSAQVKKYKKVESGNVYKKHMSKNVDVADGKAYNNKSLTNVKESLVVSKSHKKNKKPSGTELLKDLSNGEILRTELCSPNNTIKKLENKSTESLARNNKSYHVPSPKTPAERQKCLSKINAKICIIKGKESKVDADSIYPYLKNSFNKENKSSSNLLNNEPMILKSKQIEDSYNKPNVTGTKRMSPTTDEDKFKEIVKKPKNVVLVKSNYVKFVENKGWFLGSPSKSLISKPVSSISEDSKEKSKDILKCASLKLADIRVQNKEKVCTKEASRENSNQNSKLKDAQANEEKISHNLEKCSNLKKRVLKIKTGMNNSKTNKTCELLRKVNPLGKVLDSNLQQSVNKLEQKPNNSIFSKFEKQSADKDDGKVTPKLRNAESILSRKIELVSNKTKPSVPLSKSLFDTNKSISSKGNNSYDLLSKTCTRKDNTDVYSVEDQFAKQQNILNYNAAPLFNKKLKRTRKLHSKKLGSKYSELKMYGEEKNIPLSSHVRSLKSTQVVHKNVINKTDNEVSSLESRNFLIRNFRNKMRQSNKKLFPIAVQNRSLYTVQNTPGITTTYLCKRLLTTTAAKNIENYYFDISNTNESFQRGESMVKAKNFFKDKFAVKTNNVKRTIIINGIDEIQKLIPEPADVLKCKEKKGNTTGLSFEKCAERDNPISAGGPLTQKTDHSFEIIYERNKTKSKDCLNKNIEQKDRQFNMRTSKHTSGVALRTFNSNNVSNISHSPFKYDVSDKTKSAIPDNTNSTVLKKQDKILIPKKITIHELSPYNKVSNMLDKKILEKEITKTTFQKQNKQQNAPNGNDRLESKERSLIHTSEVFPKELAFDKPEKLKDHLEPCKGNKSLPNLMYTYLEPVGLSVIEPLKWRSKSERLKSFLFKTNGSEVRNIKKRTLIKSSTIHNNNKIDNSVTSNNNTNPTTDIDKLNESINNSNTSNKTSKRKETQKSNVNSFLQDNKKHVDANSYKTETRDKTHSVDKRISNKDVILIDAKQKSIPPLEHKSVSNSFFNRNSQNKFKIPHKFSVIGKNVNTDKIELMKRPLSKPTLNEHKTTISSTNLDSIEQKNLSHGKSSETIIKNKGTIGNFLNYQQKNSFKNRNIKLNFNKSSLAKQTVNKHDETNDQTVFNKDEKSEQDKSNIKWNQPKLSQKTSKTKAAQDLKKIDCSVIKMEVEPKTLAFSSNFNLPINILAQHFKSIKDSPNTNDMENSESTKEIKAKQHYEQFQLLKSAIPNKYKQAISVMEKQEERPIAQINKSMHAQSVSDISQHAKNISCKTFDKCDENNSSKPHTLYTPKPLLPFNIVNRKSHLMKTKSQISKQTQSKTMNTVNVTGTDKKYLSKTPRFPIGLLAKHFMKKEKRLTADEKKEEKSHKVESEKKPNITKVIKSIKAEPKVTSKKISLQDEKEKKSDIKKELTMITGSNLTLNFDKLIKIKGRDKFYIQTEKAHIKQDDRLKVKKGQALQINNKAKNLIISAKLGNNNASMSNKCLEKIVDYGIKQSTSTQQHKGLIKCLKMKKSSESFSNSCKAKNLMNKPSLDDSSSFQTQDKLSSPASLEIGTNRNLLLSAEDIGRMKKKIRSKNSFRVFKGNQTMKKRQLELIERKKCEKKVQLKNQSKTRGNLSKAPTNNFIYLSPINPKSKGVYVVEIKPSNPKDPSVNSSSKVLKGSSVSFSKHHIQKTIPDPIKNELKSFRSR